MDYITASVFNLHQHHVASDTTPLFLHTNQHPTFTIVVQVEMWSVPVGETLGLGLNRGSRSCSMVP